jgi:hypothetical protein
VTIVVWDGATLAVDRGVTDGYTMWEQDKAWRLGNAVLTGVGNMTLVLAMRNWYVAGRDASKFPTEQTLPDRWCEFIVATPDGLFRYERSPIPIEHGKNKCAFGYGKDFASGALAMGATAEQAVSIANKFSPHCGMGVDVFNFEGESNGTSQI